MASALLAGVLAAQAPVGGPTLGVPGDWPTAGANAQRDGWLRADPYIGPDQMKQGGFDLQWKLQLEWPRTATRFTGGAAVGGRKPLTFYSDSSGRVWAIDNDTGFDFWQRSLGTVATSGCTAPLSAGITKWTALIAPVTGAARGGGFGAAVRPAYSSVVSEPGAGLAELIMAPRGGAGRGAAPAAGARGAPTPAPPTPGPTPATAGPAPAVPAPATPGRAGNDAPAPAPPRAGGAGGGARGGGGGRGASGVFALAPDGVLHILGENSGIDVQKPIPFLKPNADTRGLSVVANVAYVLTTNRCAGSENGVAAIDLASEGKEVTFWRTSGGAPIGMPAFGQDGTLYVAVGAGGAAAGGGGYANAIVALEPRTLKVKDWFTQPGTAFTGSPIVARTGERDVLVAPTSNGRVLLLDAGSLGGADHRTPAFTSPVYGGVALSSAAATYRDQAGTAWVLLPIAGRPTASTALSNGAVSSGAILALKVADRAGALSLDPAWVSRDLTAPWAPVVVNGVIFALSSGTRTTAASSVPAVLYVLDPATGRTTWDSGKAITTSAGAGALVTGNSQIHVTTPSGMVYAFGFAMERH